MELSFFVIFVILNQHSPVTANLACESDQSENDGSCYYFSESESNFATSKSSCEDLGMHLVSIGSQEEQNFMQSSISSGNKELWIGLSQLSWIDGSSLDYNNFANGENDNYLASHIFNDGGICFLITGLQSRWYDSSCSGASYYICENEIEDNAACTAGQRENDGSCYYFSQSRSNFDTSKSSCDDLGMHLVYIGSEDEQEFLVNNLPVGDFDYWIGLSSVTWLDGSSLTYSNFAADSHIISNNGMCFVINRDKSYQWLDDDCNIEHHYICEREEGHTSFKNFRLLASNVAHIDAYVLSSFTVSSMIECSQLCLTDVRCSCYTFIACEGLCLLGEECLATSTFAFERRIGATFYSALLED